MKITLLLPSLSFHGSSLWCQEVPKVEVFGGYSYLNADTNNQASPSRQSANGWEASVSGNFNRWFALEGDFSGYYKSGIDVPALGGGTASLDDFGFGAGPRVNVHPVFFHALAGVSHFTGSASGFSRSQNSFAGAFGGGVQWKLGPRWAVRASADYLLTRHNIPELLLISHWPGDDPEQLSRVGGHRFSSRRGWRERPPTS
jgi:hypothetical protein